MAVSVLMPNTPDSVPLVKRIEMAIMQFAILNKAKEGEVTRDNLKQIFRGNLQMSGDHFDHCMSQLVEEGHLKDIGGSKYTITDDGREDYQKLSPLALELPNLTKQGSQMERPGMAQQPSAGARTGSMGSGNPPGNTGQGVQGGNVGNPSGGSRQNR